MARTATVGGALALSWAAVSTVVAQGHLDAFADASGSVANATGSRADVAGAVVTDPLTEKVERLSEKYGCSTSGLGEGVMPARTLVRIAGEVRVATFDEGWAVHLGHAPGSLVAVCAR